VVGFCGAGVLGIEVFGVDGCDCIFGVDGCDCTPREELPKKLLSAYIKVEE
jgi:hypothetical protein